MKRIFTLIFLCASTSMAGNIIVQAPSSVSTGVTSISTSTIGGTALTGAVSFVPGTNVTMAQGGNTITISATSGGSGSGIVSPGTFTWVNQNGLDVSTISVKNGGQAVWYNGANSNSITAKMGDDNILRFTPTDLGYYHFAWGSPGAPAKLSIGDPAYGIGHLNGLFRVFGYDQTVYELGGIGGGGMFLHQSVSGFMVNNGGGGSANARAVLDVVGQNTQRNSLFVSTSNAGNYNFAVSTNGHMMVGGLAPTLNSCGAGAAVAGRGGHFYVTVGAAVTSCGITFGQGPYPSRPVCNVTPGIQSITNPLSYVITASSVTLNQTGLAGNIVDVNCFGFE